nr:hypothetical protein [Nanoarchaeum sp.]
MNTIDIALRPVNMGSLSATHDSLIPAYSFLDGYLLGLHKSNIISITERHPSLGRWEIELTDQDSDYFFMSKDQVAMSLTKLVDNYLECMVNSELTRKYDILIR